MSHDHAPNVTAKVTWPFQTAVFPKQWKDIEKIELSVLAN
jgi:hypothetical protein